MRLPPTNTLILTDAPIVLDGAEMSAVTDADVLALLPAWVRRVRSKTRDAIIQQTRRYWQWLHDRHGFALNALRTPRHASGQGLDAHGRHRPRAPGERDGAYRERLLAHPAIITPNAIRDAVHDLVRAERAIDPVVFEPSVDAFFAGSEDATWSCFATSLGAPPLWGYFPDSADVQVGWWLPNVQQSLGPAFVVLLEGGLSDDAEAVYAMDVDTAADAFDASSFAGSVTTAWGYMTVAAPPLEQRLIADVESRRGAGVVWVLFIVPNLGGAL